MARWSNHPKTLSWNCLWALFYPRGTANCPPLQNSRRNFAAFRIKSAGLKPLSLSLDLSISLSLLRIVERNSPRGERVRDWTEKNRPPRSNRRPLNSETCIVAHREKTLTPHKNSCGALDIRNLSSKCSSINYPSNECLLPFNARWILRFIITGGGDPFSILLTSWRKSKKKIHVL